MRIVLYILIPMLLASCSEKNASEFKTLKVAIAQVPQLFNGFKFHQEMKGEMQQKAERLKLQQDSLKFMYLSLEEKLNAKTNVTENEKRRLNNLKQNYFSVQEKLQKDLQVEGEKYDQQITVQLNEYINAYGEENGYDIIYGHYESNILYAKDGFDITEELIQYVNKKYQNE